MLAADAGDSWSRLALALSDVIELVAAAE